MNEVVTAIGDFVTTVNKLQYEKARQEEEDGKGHQTYQKLCDL